MRGTRVLGAGLLIALAFAVAPTARASRTRLGGVRKDYRNAFAIAVPDEWSAVPPRVDGSVEVAGWYGPRKGEIAPTLRVLRIPRRLPRKAGQALEEPEELARAPGPGAPLSVKDWLDRQLEPYRNLARIEERKEIRIGREKGELYRATRREASERGSVMVRLLVTVLRTDRAEFGVVFTCEDQEFESVHKAAFAGILRSFRVLRIRGEKDIDYEEAYEAEREGGRDEAAQAAWLDRAKATIDASPDWGRLSTRHYLVLFDRSVRPEDVKRVAVQIEAIRKDVYEPMFPPVREIRAISIVRVCKDREQYVAYGGPPMSVGYWNAGDQELVFYADSPSAIRTLYHEAFHQYIHYAFGELDPHTWFNEGHGEYFAGFEFRGRFEPGRCEGRRAVIRQAIQDGSTVPLAKFLRYSRGEYYADARLCYAEGWALVYFLHHSPKAEYRKILPTYFDTLKRGLAVEGAERATALEAALDAAFEGVDPDQLEKDWAAFDY